MTQDGTEGGGSVSPLQAARQKMAALSIRLGEIAKRVPDDLPLLMTQMDEVVVAFNELVAQEAKARRVEDRPKGIRGWDYMDPVWTAKGVAMADDRGVMDRQITLWMRQRILDGELVGIIDAYSGNKFFGSPAEVQAKMESVA